MRRLLFIIIVISLFKSSVAQISEAELCDIYKSVISELGENVVAANIVLPVDKEKFNRDIEIQNFFDSLNIDIENLDNWTYRLDLKQIGCLKIKFLTFGQYIYRFDRLNLFYRYRQKNTRFCVFSGLIYNTHYTFLYVSEYSRLKEIVFYHYFLLQKKDENFKITAHKVIKLRL